MKATITLTMGDEVRTQWEWVRNEDGTWMGPLAGDDSMTDQEVWEQIQKVVAGDLN